MKTRILAQLLDRIPPEYRGFDLATIEPDTGRHPGQTTLIPALLNNPDTSLFLVGKHGTGKSLFGWLLYKRAVRLQRPAVAVSLPELMAQWRRYECGAEELPAITSENLRKSHPRHFVFLDEIDKARATEFASEQLWALTDAIYSNRHQLVITSNMDKDALRAHWSDAGGNYGVSIMRRLLELDGMARKEMF